MDLGHLSQSTWVVLATAAICLATLAAALLERRVLVRRLNRARTANANLRTELAVTTAALFEARRQHEYITIVDGPVTSPPTRRRPEGLDDEQALRAG